MAIFDLQGHRGARGLKPENTLPSFEAAFDAGATSVETDVHLTRDGVPVLFHDAALSERSCRLLTDTGLELGERPLISALTAVQIRGYRADVNPDPQRFPEQTRSPGPVAEMFAGQRGVDPYTIPTLEDLFAFAGAYTGDVGRLAHKSETQVTSARAVRFDLELKRVPFTPETIGDGFDGRTAGLLERRVVEVVRKAKMVGQVSVRSFDHRSVAAARKLEPALGGAVLIGDMAPVALGQLVRAAGASMYCPAYQFLDEAQVRQAHEENIRVVPWTVNDPASWERLLAWGVDGICTDYPDRLAAFLGVVGRAS